MSRHPAVPEVLILTPDFPPEIGGIQTLVFRLAAGFTRFRPRVVTIASEASAAFDQGQALRVKRVSLGSNRRLRMAALNIAGIVDALQSQPAVILSAHIVTGPSALLAGRLLRRPVVQYVYAQELTRRQGLAKYVLTHANAILATSEYSRSLVERIAESHGRTQIVHPGVDVAPNPPEPAVAGSSIVVVARLTERYKGHDVLLEALPLVRDSVPDAHLHIVGDGPLRSELERLARDLGVAPATTFHGKLTDTQRDSLFRGTNVFAMPSRIEEGGAGEGFGIVYVEAGAHGLPVVAGNVGGALDAVVDGETGLLVDPRSRHSVAEALIALLQDRDKARRMGHAGWERARSLSWAKAAAAVEALLDEVAAE